MAPFQVCDRAEVGPGAAWSGNGWLNPLILNSLSAEFVGDRVCHLSQNPA